MYIIKIIYCNASLPDFYITRIGVGDWDVDPDIKLAYQFGDLRFVRNYCRLLENNLMTNGLVSWTYHIEYVVSNKFNWNYSIYGKHGGYAILDNPSVLYGSI